MQYNPQPHRPRRKPKRFRSAFTTEQINYLERQFRQFPYINSDHRKQVAAFLKMEERPIKIWFQNRRMKKKKENHKEFDVDIYSYPQEFGKDQLNNVPVMPLTNDQWSNSLTMPTSIANATAKTNSYSVKVNKHKHQITITNPENIMKLNASPKVSHSNANYYKDTSNQEHLSPYFHRQPTNNATLPFTTNLKNLSVQSQQHKSNTSAEFSIDLCKKYKQKTAANTAVYSYGDNITVQQKKMKKLGQTQPSKEDAKHCRPSKDFSASKKPQKSYPALPPTQVHLNNPAYYPVMPTMYVPPFVSPGGAVWNPVNVMPVMAIKAPSLSFSNCQGPPAHGQSKNCGCNCQGSGQNIPITLPTSLQNPYAQYVITVPYLHTSP